MADANWIYEKGIIAILRGDFSEHLFSLVDALYEGGIRIIEITTNSPDAMGIIARLSKEYQDHMWIGAGTVLTVKHVEEVANAGGQFIVSPDTFPDVIKCAIEVGLEPIPGAYTSSEIRTAVRAGARFIKLFPAMPIGPNYLKQLRGPLSNVAFVATGGVGIDDVDSFIRAGAVALGLGSSLVPKSFSGTVSEIKQVTSTATEFCNAIIRARSE